jgi:Cu/Ag efflux protein CusF
LSATFVAFGIGMPAAASAQGGNMGNMQMNQSPPQAAPMSGTGTVAALNQAERKVTFDHGPIPEMKWPAMKMEFIVAPSVDLSKVKTGDKLRFMFTAAGNTYTVQSLAPAQ